MSKTIPGTTPFDGDAAQKGYALNKMCFSFNDKDNREAFVADPEAYMKRYGLNAQQAEAIRGSEVARRPGSRVVRMAVRDHRPVHRAPGVDEEVASGAVQALRPQRDQVGDGHTGE